MSENGKPLLTVNNIEVIYDHVILVLKGVSLQVPEGGIVALLGANGAGKSTTLKAISGLLRTERGEVTKGAVEFLRSPIHRRDPADIVRRGVVQVMEGRHVFEHLTVEENLLAGAYTRRNGRSIGDDLERVYRYFPRLKERRTVRAGYVSGGEQQMLAIGRALMTRPTLLCMDEPSMGLSPGYVEQVFDIIKTINQQGTTLFVVEQNVNMALSIAHRGYVLQMGEVVLSGTARELLENPLIQKAYLGTA